MKTYYILVILLLISSCNHFNSNRYPASTKQTVFPTKPKMAFHLDFAEIKAGLEIIAKKSSAINKVNHFYMDPVTRVFNLNLELNLPLEKLMNFASLNGEQSIGDSHELDIAFKFSKTKSIARSKYLGLQLTKFKIDGDDYLHHFEIALSAIKTILANSDMTDYIFIKNRAVLDSKNKRDLVNEIFEDHSIVVFPETKKINLKLDLAKFDQVAPMTKKIKHLKLWRISPSVYKTAKNLEGVSFYIVIGEGRPHQDWLKKELNLINEEQNALTEDKEDFYIQYSDYKPVIEEVSNTIKKALSESLNSLAGTSNKANLKQIYMESIDNTVSVIQSDARKILNKNNDHFSADPEYEYIQFKKNAMAKTRVFIGETKRKIRIDQLTLDGGDKTKSDSPLVTKRVSQRLLNGAMNFVIDTKFKEVEIFKQAELWLNPQNSSVIFKGILNLPMKYLLSKLNSEKPLDDFKSHILETETGIKFELSLFTKMGDNGVLSLDINQLSLKINGKRNLYRKSSKNHKFLMNITKVFLAQSLASLNIKIDDGATISKEEKEKRDLQKIVNFIGEIKTRFKKQTDPADIMLSDLEFNHTSGTGNEYISRKKEIIMGELIKFNPITELFDVQLNPDVVFDKVMGVRHNLQVWGLTPISSPKLKNNYLEMAVGEGLRLSLIHI